MLYIVACVVPTIIGIATVLYSYQMGYKSGYTAGSQLAEWQQKGINTKLDEIIDRMKKEP